MQVTPYDIAAKYLNLKEVPGKRHNSTILGFLQRVAPWVETDETAWCSAFVRHPFWELGLPHSKKLNARSWLEIGEPITLDAAERGHDVVILWRGSRTAWTGHVGFFHSRPRRGQVALLGGNQGDAVSIKQFPVERVLGVRRIV